MQIVMAFVLLTTTFWMGRTYSTSYLSNSMTMIS